MMLAIAYCPAEKTGSRCGNTSWTRLAHRCATIGTHSRPLAKYSTDRNRAPIPATGLRWIRPNSRLTEPMAGISDTLQTNGAAGSVARSASAVSNGEVRDFLALLWKATLETLAIATAGMALALAVALPCALIATRALSISALSRGGRPHRWAQALRWPVRGLLIILRSVPEIVWALLFVRAVGLGPTAGVLAIAITYAGMLGKVYAEIFESVDPLPTRALLGAGSTRLQAFAYAVLPQASGEMLSYTVYRWECAIRASVVMGFVGAGGLGQQMDLSMRMFAGGEVASMLLTFLLLVLLADLLSQLLRRRFV